MINLIKQLLDWIYNRVCYFCHKSSPSGLMCDKCYENVELNFPEPIKILGDIRVYSSNLYADNIKKLIRGLKYHKQKELAFYMAQFMYTFWQKLEISREEFEIIPMPLFTKRQKERGYNHVELIAEEFAKLTGYSVNVELVKRIKATKPQYKLRLNDRVENLKNAFVVDSTKYNGKKLLLMDDICTTGTTFNELIETLKKHNITDLCAIVGAHPTIS